MYKYLIYKYLNQLYFNETNGKKRKKRINVNNEQKCASLVLHTGDSK